MGCYITYFCDDHNIGLITIRSCFCPVFSFGTIYKSKLNFLSPAEAFYLSNGNVARNLVTTLVRALQDDAIERYNINIKKSQALNLKPILQSMQSTGRQLAQAQPVVDMLLCT